MLTCATVPAVTRRIDNDEAFDHALRQGGGAVSLFAQFLLTLDALLGELAHAFGF